MAPVERLVETETLKTHSLTTLLEHNPSFLQYDAESDILMLLVVPPTTETVVHYIDGNVALLYEPESREVVGIQVEAFQRSVLPEHASLKRVWRLSDAGLTLENIGELIVVFERKKQDMARELTSMAESVLARKGMSGQRLVPV